MAVEFKQVDGAPIYYGDFYGTYDAIKDNEYLTAQLDAVITQTTGPIVYIAEASKIDLSFSDIAMGLNEIFKRGIVTPFTHPRVKFLVAGDSEMVRLASEAAKQEQYNSVDIQLFASLDEAIAYARQYLAQIPS